MLLTEREEVMMDVSTAVCGRAMGYGDKMDMVMAG